MPVRLDDKIKNELELQVTTWERNQKHGESQTDFQKYPNQWVQCHQGCNLHKGLLHSRHPQLLDLLLSSELGLQKCCHTLADTPDSSLIQIPLNKSLEIWACASPLPTLHYKSPASGRIDDVNLALNVYQSVLPLQQIRAN